MLGEEHPDTIATLGNLGRFLQAVDRLAEAEPVLRETLEKKRRVRGVEHPDTLTSINNYGVVLEAMGRPAEAETYYRDAMEKCRRVLGPEHPNTFITTINTGGALQAQGRNAEAVKILDGVEPAARKAFTGANVRWVAKLLTRRGKARTALGNARRRREGPPRGVPPLRLEPRREPQGDAGVRPGARRPLHGPAGRGAGARLRRQGRVLGGEAPSGAAASILRRDSPAHSP